jgi:protoporphyrinogen oxidase
MDPPPALRVAKDAFLRCKGRECAKNVRDCLTICEFAGIRSSNKSKQGNEIRLLKQRGCTPDEAAVGTETEGACPIVTRVVVIGAGVAGLAAAYHLLELQPHWEVYVFEQEATAGGLARKWQIGQFSADLGPHRIYTELPEIERILPELIASDQALVVQRRSELLLQNHFYAYPVRASELLREMGFVKMGFLALSAVEGRLRSIIKRPSNYAEAMVQAFGRGVYHLIIRPYTQKVWKTPPEALSDEVARVRVSAGNTNRLVRRLIGAPERKGQQTALGTFTYIRGGVENLVRNLAQRVERRGGHLETGWRAARLKIEGNRLCGIDFQSSDGTQQRPVACDYVISTIPLPDLVEMVAEHLPMESALRAAHQLEYVGMILVGVSFHRPQLTPNSWLYFPEEHIVFNRAYEPRNFDPDMAPKGSTLVVFEVTARWDSHLWRMTDEQIAELVVHDLVAIGLARCEEIDSVACHRIRHAYPIYRCGFRAELKKVCHGLAHVPNLLTTGRQGLFNHNNMDHSMLMGIRAAETVAIHPTEPATAWYANLDQFDHFRIVD